MKRGELTSEDTAIVHSLRHVPFMAWLVEVRDECDYTAVLERMRHDTELARATGYKRRPATWAMLEGCK